MYETDSTDGKSYPKAKSNEAYGYASTPAEETFVERPSYVLINVNAEIDSSLPVLPKIGMTMQLLDDYTEIIIEDDGDGYPNDILSKIGEPYLKSLKEKNKNKVGLGLGLFIGKTLLEKNFATITCNNSKTRGGAEVIIKWKNKDLFKI